MRLRRRHLEVRKCRLISAADLRSRSANHDCDRHRTGNGWRQNVGDSARTRRGPRMASAWLFSEASLQFFERHVGRFDFPRPKQEEHRQAESHHVCKHTDRCRYVVHIRRSRSKDWLIFRRCGLIVDAFAGPIGRRPWWSWRCRFWMRSRPARIAPFWTRSRSPAGGGRLPRRGRSNRRSTRRSRRIERR